MAIRNRSRSTRASLALLLAPMSSALAQGICLPGSGSHEARTLAALSVPIVFTAASSPGTPSGVSVGLEAADLPRVSNTLATPTICRPGKGPENAHPIAAVVRPRLAIALAGVVVEVSWIPPVTVHQVRADLFGVAAGRVVPLSASWVLGLRADAVFGSLHAPVTCPDAALADPTSECYGGMRSDDSWRPGLYGVEASIGRHRGRVLPYGGVGFTVLRPRFQVDFTNAAGATDRTRVDVDMTRVALFAGLAAPFGPLTGTAELYATLSDPVIGRVVLRMPLK